MMLRTGRWAKTENKQKTRLRVAKVFAQRKPKLSIFLPGEDIMCLREIYKTGCITPSMKFILVERCNEIMGKIKDKVMALCPKLYSQCVFHLGELHDVKLPKKIEFSFIDLLGNFDRQTFEWFRNVYLKNSLPNTVTFLTFQKAYRGNDFMRAWRYRVWVADKKLKSLFFYHRENLKSKYPTCAEKFYNRRVPFTLWLVDGLFRETKHHFQYRKIKQYKDLKTGIRAVSMLFMEVRMLNKPCQVDIPDLSGINFDEVQEDFRKYKETYKKPKLDPVVVKEQLRQLKHKLAGQKAALTRLQNRGTKGDAEIYKSNIAALTAEQMQLENLLQA